MKKFIYILLSVSSYVQSAENYLIEKLQNAIDLPEKLFLDLKQVVKENAQPDIPLFRKFESLKNSISYVRLANLPTPVTFHKNFADKFYIKDLYIKNDGLTGGHKMNGKKLFGGNKARKLEFLLADAIKCGCKSVITFGAAGSNHAVATACYADLLGLKSTIILGPQLKSEIIKRNLLLDIYYGANIVYMPKRSMRFIECAHEFINHKKIYGQYPYVIPTGGSNYIGAFGYVNAAIELEEQVKSGLLKEPDFIYVSAGSCGTVAGLLVGLKLTSLKSKIIAVAIEPEEYAGQFIAKIKKVHDECFEYLKSNSNEITHSDFKSNDFIISFDHTGPDYAHSTSECLEAIEILKGLENVNLDQVYTAKAFSKVIQDGQNKILMEKTVLFWNTFCSEDFCDVINQYNFAKLPEALHEYFLN